MIHRRRVKGKRYNQMFLNMEHSSKMSDEIQKYGVQA